MSNRRLSALRATRAAVLACALALAASLAGTAPTAAQDRARNHRCGDELRRLLAVYLEGTGR
mgnify:CR=1 FL=1